MSFDWCKRVHLSTIYAGITPVDGACKCILYLDLAKCGGNNVTNVAPGHRGDTAGAGAGGVRAKINNNNGISGDR